MNSHPTIALAEAILAVEFRNISCSAVEPYEAAQIPSRLKIGVTAIDVLKAIGLRDQFAQFQFALLVKRQKFGNLDPWAGETIYRAHDRLL
jgi:hypothetical protein